MTSIGPIRDLVSTDDLDLSQIKSLLSDANKMKDLVCDYGGDDRLKNKVIASLFYEPSTRTSCSFTAAMMRLGGQVHSLNESSSSSKKGESFDDTIQTLSCYFDAIIIRHPARGSAKSASCISKKPILNAGDGSGEHPSQALLDIFTIYSELGNIGTFKNSQEKVFEKKNAGEELMTITLMGDLKNGRTVHSLAKVLSLFDGIHIQYLALPSLEMPEEIISDIALSKNIKQTVLTCSIEDAIATTDVLYVTRIQKERFESIKDYEKVLDGYCIDAKMMTHAKKKMIIMHPLPRVSEIAKEVDDDPRAAYFRQMEFGMYMRMAILDQIFKTP
tara:strand:- start:18610 stop:19602 length:993 start_codon:yes stop_codon:yes gene_type:complete